MESLTQPLPMRLSQAQAYAAKIVDWLRPCCERIEIAGSIRRGRPYCGDVDLVVIPRRIEIKDLLGVGTGRRNLLWEFLAGYVKEKAGGARWLDGGESPGKQCRLRLPRCQLDIWFATGENFASLLLCRTGSKEHNVWLCERAVQRGGKWSYGEGLRLQGGIVAAEAEFHIYHALGLSFIEPALREADWIRKNIQFGLES